MKLLLLFLEHSFESIRIIFSFTDPILFDGLCPEDLIKCEDNL